MGNTTRSLTFAASLLAAAPNTKAQLVDARVDATRKALVELANGLPAGYDAAKKVLKNDEILLDDGDLSVSDKVTIGEHADKLAGVAKNAAQAVKDALSDNNNANNGDQGAQQVGAPQIPIPPKPRLGSKEAEEQKKQKERTDRLRKEMLSKINKTVNNKSSWRVDGAASGDAVIANKDGGIEIKFKSRKADSAIQEGYALFDMQLPEGTYNFKLDADGALVMWLFDENGKQLNMDGTLPETGKNRVPINPGNNTITISPAVKRISMGAKVTALTPSRTIKGIIIAEDAQAALANAGK